jgi:Domain of unknown function (DUF4328)
MSLPPIQASFSASPLGAQGEAYRSPRARAKLVTAALVLDLAALIVVATLLWDSLGVAQALAAGEDVSDASFALLERRGAEMELIAGGVLLACVVMFCLWTHRVAKNSVAMGANLSITPGWAVGYYFIPIVSWWMPYAAMVQVWDASDPDPRSDPHQSRSHGLLVVWWISWLASRGVHLVVSRWEEPADAQAWIDQIVLGFVGLGVEAVAVVFAIAMVWRLTRRQEARFAALMPEARVA